MYGTSGYFMGGQGFQPLSASAQGAPINYASAAPGGSRYREPVPGAQRPNNSFAQAQGLNPNAPGTSLYDQFDNAPEWIQKYVEQRMIGEGQPGFYSQALQARDIYQGLAPSIQQLLGSGYTTQQLTNPYFARAGSQYNLGDFGDPFAGYHKGMSRGMAGELGAPVWSHSKQRNGDHWSSHGYYDPFVGRVETSAPKHRRLW